MLNVLQIRILENFLFLGMFTWNAGLNNKRKKKKKMRREEGG